MSHSSAKARILGLIPAKGASVRFARKNILPLGDRPLLAWTVEAARESGLIDRLIVSTEDEEIAAVARDLGAEVPFMRPAHLARDPAGVVEVALHALDMLEARGESYRTIIIMLPTCPFRSAGDIRSAYELFREKNATCLMSVSPFSHTPFAAMRLDKDGYLSPYFPECAGRKSQKMPAAYRPNGALHILSVETLRRERSYFVQPLVGYLMPLERSFDIDTAMDLQSAELFLAMKTRDDS